MPPPPTAPIDRNERSVRDSFSSVRILLIAVGLLFFTDLRVLVADDAAPIPKEQLEFFEKKIRPVLVEHCYQCHAADSKIVRGGLLVDSRAGLLQGGDSGPAIMTDAAEESPLISALRYESFEMPPDQKLPESVIRDFEAWIKMGAPDPRTQATPAVPRVVIDLEEGRKFWSFQSPRPQKLPEVTRQDWPRNDIDRFILARQEEKGLSPGQDASRDVLLRRLYLDLIGLPPTPEELREFMEDSDQDAVVRVVDRLLASPHFGERWGRHWLDSARYSDSTGGGRSLLYKEAWRYRDYVINAFNKDKPFDQFIVEQLAGDLLPYNDLEQGAEQLIGTAFLALGPSNYEEQDKEQLRMDVIDEQIDTTGRVFLGLTLGCARCHDHKFDPIPATDYYALAGIFRSTLTLKHDNVSTWTKRMLPVTPEHQLLLTKYDETLRPLEGKVAQTNRKITQLKNKQPKKETSSAVAKNDGDATSQKPDTGNNTVMAETAMLEAELADLQTQLRELTNQVEELKKDAPPRPPEVLCVVDEAAPADYHVCLRGSFRTPGPTVRRGFLSVATTDNAPVISNQESGRLQLAHWIADPKNPLTSRVIVNRIWSRLFGHGIVRTVDDFGKTGESPSHPELLDSLALEFTADGWSMKNLLRRIVLSRTYQLASDDSSAETKEIDPENRLLTRQNRRRLDAEALQDILLFVSGELNTELGGNTMHPDEVETGYQFKYERRAVYLPVLRNQLPEIFSVFDFPDPNLSIGRRTSSTLATQALFMLNSPFVRDRAANAAKRLLAGPEADTDARLQWLTLSYFGRQPTARERELIRESLKNSQELPPQQQWERICQALTGSISFRYLE